MDVIHPNPLTQASPSQGALVTQNPPSLLWPTSAGTSVRYTVRLSMKPKFPKRSTISQAGLPWAMYTPSRALDKGVWYWQVGVSKRSGKTTWSDTYSFEVTKDRTRSLPSAEDVLKTAASSRPRLLPPVEGELRSSAAQALSQELYNRICHLLDQELPDDTTTPAEGDDEYKRMKLARWGSKRLAAEQVSAIEDLICAGHLSRDERFIKEAERRALHVATWDPDGFTNPVISDFADASCMRAMALVYDSCHDRLSGKERRLLRNALVARAERFYESSNNDVEARLFGAHLWQHLLTEFFEASLALLGDVPEAGAWCRYIYELWIARFPLIAGDDGGWANGPKYFATNVETLILMSHYFDRFGAGKFDTQPWFRNASKFLRYAWAPGSDNDGFGDGTELEDTPKASHVHWMEHLGHRFSDPHAIAYAEAWKEAGVKGHVSPRLEMLSLSWKPPRKREPKPDPGSVLFRDTGLVAAHTDRGRMDRNLNVAFRSSPFGSFNHMHSCQNAFNILYGGERLLANSGYYIAMADEHAKEWYRHTRGHNSVLIDGQGQGRGPEAFGWIPRYIAGDRITAWTGDASHAYGSTGLVRFRRHVAVLNPNVVILYDDLEANHDATWTWRLHAHGKLGWSSRASRFTTRNTKGMAQLAFSASCPVTVELDDTHDPAPLNWGGKSYQGKTVDRFPNRWHASVETNPSSSARFLAVLTVDRKKPPEARQLDDGVIRVGQWRIEAEMDTSLAAGLTVTGKRTGTCLAIDRPSLTFQGRSLRAGGQTVLLEDGRARRSRDRYPDAVSGR